MDGKVITYEEMKKVADFRLQRGINFKPNRQDISYLLMSQRQDAPYRDSIETDGSILYEGHDVRKTKNVQNPKSIYQPKYNKNGSLSQNGHFYEAAIKYKSEKDKAIQVQIYEKYDSGIWFDLGLYHLIDAWQEHDGTRNVFKFKLTKGLS